jgi:hypothetical protein
MQMWCSEPLRPCANCKRYSGYKMKRGRGKWIRICKHCDLKYDTVCNLKGKS